MLTLISKAVGYALRTVVFDDESSAPNNIDHIQTFSATDYRKLRDPEQIDVLLTDIVDQKEKNADSHTIFFTGKITQLFCGHGLVDGSVYFSSDTVVGEKPPRIGDLVSVVARQQHKDGGWHAETVTIVDSSWEDEKVQEAVITGEVGQVLRFDEGKGIINKNILFTIDNCQEGFQPYVGDWVAVELEDSGVLTENNDGDDFGIVHSEVHIQATKVSPLRERTLNGIISAVMQDHGYIDGEVYFRLDACVNGYRPRKSDRVTVAAVESTQGKCSWRAISIYPLSSDSSVYRSKLRNQPLGQKRGWVVPGQRPQNPQRPHNMSIPVKLPRYPVPENLKQWVMDQKELTSFASYLTQILCMDNYSLRMCTLLHLEEIQMELDIREFDMNRVCLQMAGEFLALHVPGLAEGRPSVLIGDSVILTSPVETDGPQYEGIVHELHSDKVLLKFNNDFQSSYNGEDFNVRFTFNRTSLRRCHQAAHWAVARLGEQVLFPKQADLKAPQVDLTSRHRQNINLVGCRRKDGQPLLTEKCWNGHVTSASNVQSAGKKSFSPSQELLNDHAPSNATLYIPTINQAIQDAVTFFNPDLNVQQKAAVIQILLGQGRPLPYIIFGPPGTGKTITVVEAILQILTRIPSSRIIACTPSNSAADLLAERLHTSGVVKMSDMVRLNSFNRSDEAIADRILPYCTVGHKVDVICRYRIVISTCNTAGLLYTAGLKAGHFTHAVVDEAGQATEPECLIPAGLVAGADGQIILAGDPKQLGPVLMSPFAKMYGFELSFLERLMDRLPYQRNTQLYSEHGGFNSALVTMLVDNYRSHPSILQLPSKLFYYGQLRACAPLSLTNTLIDWHMLASLGTPIVFHGIEGDDMREDNSPSWFNPEETVQVVYYLQGLLGNKPPVHPDNIGIITPYRKQVEKIRMMIERLAIPRVKVGSVEEFQGQEMQAIIISTVRSNQQLVRSDIRHVLGFLSNPKRFNVAITRAQAMLIIIGNPHVLAQDENWRSFIQMCVENNCYKGCDLPDSLKSEKRMTEVKEKTISNQQTKDVDNTVSQTEPLGPTLDV